LEEIAKGFGVDPSTNTLVIGGAGLEATVRDADQAVGELAWCGPVAEAAGALDPGPAMPFPTNSAARPLNPLRRNHIMTVTAELGSDTNRRTVMEEPIVDWRAD
jgi:hypothetical protein